jgi:hypothetical protein
LVEGWDWGLAEMMGRQEQEQAKLFYEFCLEDRVPADHLSRNIDWFLIFKSPCHGTTLFYSIIGHAANRHHKQQNEALSSQSIRLSRHAPSRPAPPCRKVPRSVHEAARKVAKGVASTLEYLQSRCERKKVEILLAHLKRILKLNRLRLCGPSGAEG